MIPRVTQAIQVASLYLLLLFLPFSKAVVEITSTSLILAWLVERCDPRTRAQSLWWSPAYRPMAWTLAAFLWVCALSILGSRHPELGLRALFSKWLQYVLLFVVAADLSRRPAVVRQSLAVIACSALFVVIEALTQERYHYGWFRGYRLDFFNRMTGPYENPIDLATYLMVIIPALLAFLIRHRRFLVRLALGVLLVALTLCLGRTQAMGAWIGLAGGVLIVCLRSPALRRTGLVVMIATLMAGGWFLHRAGDLRSTFSVLEIGKRDRWAMWQAAVGMIRDRPVLGHGLNTFMANYLDYWVGGQQQPRYAHNCYLQVAAEIGLVGAGLFIACLWQLFQRLFALTRTSQRHAAILVSGFTAGLLAFVIQAGVDTNFYSLRQAVLFWTFAGLAIGYGSQTFSSADRAALGSR